MYLKLLIFIIYFWIDIRYLSVPRGSKQFQLPPKLQKYSSRPGVGQKNQVGKQRRDVNSFSRQTMPVKCHTLLQVL